MTRCCLTAETLRRLLRGSTLSTGVFFCFALVEVIRGMAMVEFIDMAGLTGAATRYFNSAALQKDAGSVLLITLSLCAAGAVIGLLWKWRQEGKR